jgi:iron only hydrogenase large subunit-like protein
VRALPIFCFINAGRFSNVPGISATRLLKLFQKRSSSVLKNARTLFEQIEKGTSPYAFIEIMTCPGGCLGGGGQPIPTTWSIRKQRAESIYSEDSHKTLRKSHENPHIKILYDEFLKEPLGEVSHHLLHTSYVKRGTIVWKTNGQQKKEGKLTHV